MSTGLAALSCVECQVPDLACFLGCVATVLSCHDAKMGTRARSPRTRWSTRARRRVTPARSPPRRNGDDDEPRLADEGLPPDDGRDPVSAARPSEAPADLHLAG